MLNQSPTRGIMQKQTEVEQAVARIYCSMLDNIALSEQRKYIKDLVTTTGTAAVKIENSIDAKARHCAIHGCPSCKRRVEFELGKSRARARLILMLAGLALLVVLRFVLR